MGGGHDTDYRESFTAFTERISGALDRTVEAAQGRTAVVLTSGGPVSWVTASLFGADLDEQARTGLWRRFNPLVANTGVTKLVVGRRGRTLLTFNEHSHLEATPELITYR